MYVLLNRHELLTNISSDLDINLDTHSLDCNTAPQPCKHICQVESKSFQACLNYWADTTQTDVCTEGAITICLLSGLWYKLRYLKHW